MVLLSILIQLTCVSHAFGPKSTSLKAYPNRAPFTSVKHAIGTKFLFLIACNINRDLIFVFSRSSYLQPPDSWVTAAPESSELLSLCLKRLRGLNKASIWLKVMMISLIFSN